MGLAEVWRHRTAPDEALTSLYGPSASHARAYSRIMEEVGVGPFSRHMARLRPALLEAVAPAARVTAAQGYLQKPHCTIITGWAWDPHQPDVPLEVEIYDGERRLATVPAYWYRRDLARAGLGGGRHAYRYTPPAALKDGRVHLVRARVPGTDSDLIGSPAPLVCAEAPAAAGG